MTDLLLHPDDSGEVARLVGETARLITPAERERLIGERTENLGQYARPDAPFGYLRKTVDLDDTVIYRLPETIGVVDTAELSIVDSLAGARAGLDGCVDLEGPQSPPPPLPPVPPAPRPSTAARMRYRGAHHHPRRLSPWVGLAVAVGFGLAVYAGLIAAALVVIR